MGRCRHLRGCIGLHIIHQEPSPVLMKISSMKSPAISRKNPHFHLYKKPPFQEHKLCHTLKLGSRVLVISTSVHLPVTLKMCCIIDTLLLLDYGVF